MFMCLSPVKLWTLSSRKKKSSSGKNKRALKEYLTVKSSILETKLFPINLFRKIRDSLSPT